MDEVVPGAPPRKKARTLKMHGADGEGLGFEAHNATIATANGTAYHDDGPIDRTQLVRLISQSLQRLGYTKSASQLEHESGIECEPPEGVAFREAIMSGDWARATSMLDALQVDETAQPEVRFMILEQKCLELMEQRRLKDALVCLRREMSPLQHQPDRLHMLCALLMTTSIDEIKAEASWDGTGTQSRAALLERVQTHVSTRIMVPERRLEILMQQAWELQRQRCMFNNVVPGKMDLFKDHTCSRDGIPRQTTRVLRGHHDEVWHIAFSKSGRLLASAGKDAMVIVWDAASGEMVHEMMGHTDAVCYVDWRPDDTGVLSSGSDDDHTLRLWDVLTGRCLRTYARHREGVTACVWLPDGLRFASGSTDQNLHLWNVDGSVDHTWRVRVSDLAVTKDGSKLIVACHTHKVRVFDVETKASYVLVETASITSLSVASNGIDVLVNLSSSEAHVWNTSSKQVTHKYNGHKQGRYAIRSCFGGVQEGFVLSGSEDSCVYLWHRQTQNLLEKLPGHTQSVNTVAWHPSNPEIFASGSDDCTVRLWGVDDDEEDEGTEDATRPGSDESETQAEINGLLVTNAVSL